MDLKLNREFSKEQQKKKTLKSLSLSLVTREIQIKRTLRFHHIPVKMTRIIHKMWKGKEYIHGQWGCKLVKPLYHQCEEFSKSKK